MTGTPIHDPSWHIVSAVFEGQNAGLVEPERNRGATVVECLPVSVAPLETTIAQSILAAPVGLQIANLDESRPPNYTSGGVPRSVKFNGNVFRLGAAPTMPVIPVECSVVGFDPAATAIHWRLRVCHVLGRFMNTGKYRYEGRCERLEREWQGTASGSLFRLFDPSDEHVHYSYGGGPTDRMMGGHAILSVAAVVPGVSRPLIDFAHLRILGTNPSSQDAGTFIDRAFTGRSGDVKHMLRAVFAHESGGRQFSSNKQTAVHFNFKTKQHFNASQPDCRVHFDWPDDPPGYPLAAFDFGIGISQYTRLPTQSINPGIVWDWRENMKKGINLFLDKLRKTHHATDSWRDWAKRAWAAYNGAGAAAAAYADTLAAGPEGQKVSSALVPPLSALAADLAHLDEQHELAAPPAWPPGAQ